MDLGSECSVYESVEDNEVNPESVSHADGNDIKNNGFCSSEIDQLRTGENFDARPFPGDRNGVENFQPENSPPLVVQSPGDASPPVKKGYGLRKWRRIRRDIIKDAGASLDSGKVLKRGLYAPVNPAKPTELSVEATQNSEGSIRSINMAKHRSFVDGFTARASSSDSRFAAGNDPDNSDDRSSKSSTAASVPKAKYNLTVVSGYAQENSKVKNLSGKSTSNSTQRVQQTKSRTESSKKQRGEKVEIEKENSYSSLESDSRSTNFVFVQGTPNSNGNLSGASINFDVENSDEAHASQHEEMHAGCSKENVEEVEDNSPDDSAADLSWKAKEEKIENHQSSADRYQLESILTLQSLQEALEKELEKLREIGGEYTGLGNSSSESSMTPTDFSSDQMGCAEIKQSSSPLVLKLTEKVKLLESELEQMRNMLQEKDSRVAELSNILSAGYTEMEMQVQGLLKQKMEAEIECIVMSAETRNYRFHALREQKAKKLDKLRETESKAKMIKKQEDEDSVGTEVIVKVQRRVRSVTCCFFIQLILLLFMVWLFVSQFSPQSGMVVPT